MRIPPSQVELNFVSPQSTMPRARDSRVLDDDVGSERFSDTEASFDFPACGEQTPVNHMWLLPTIKFPALFSKPGSSTPELRRECRKNYETPAGPLRIVVLKFALAALYFVCCVYTTCLANAYLDRPGYNLNFRKKPEQMVLLYDSGMEFLSRVADKLSMPTSLPDALVLVAVGWVFLLCLAHKSFGLRIFQRFLLITGFVYLIRAPAVLMTVLPTAFPQCESAEVSNIFLHAWKAFTGQVVTCSDVFFSGHSIFIVEAALLWLTYSTRSQYALPVLFTSVLGLLSILGARYHYSIDIFFGALIVLTTHSIYHWIARGQVLQDTIVGRAVSYMECRDRDSDSDSDSDSDAKQATACRPKVLVPLSDDETALPL